MPLTERQRAMLQVMGLRVWPAPLAESAAPMHDHDTVADAAIDPAREVAPETAKDVVTGTSSDAAQAPREAKITSPTLPAHPAVKPVRPERATAVAAREAPAEPFPEGVGQMDWPDLRQAVQTCTACRLCQGRTQTVFGTGNPRAHWMVVGEAPGEQEDLQGEPFVGKSGQLLDNILRALTLSRSDGPPEQQVYIANTVKCRPPSNRNPEPDELAQCEPFLLRQLALVQPRVIVAMGRFAVQSLLRSTEPVGRLRGQVHRYQGVPLIVTYHPAYLLRNLADKAKAWEDWCLAREVVKTAPSQ